MKHTKRTIGNLRRGDIININVPFEENTRDYYNGYKPEEIRSKPFTDRFGQTSKTRMVLYMGRDGNDMHYLPITSQNNHHYDRFHQYQLKDNSMTPKTRDPNRKSFVEVDSLRAIRVAYKRRLDYTGRITKEDLANIMHRISNNTLQFNSFRDQRGIVPDDMVNLWERELEYQGYTLKTEQDDRKIYKKGDTQTISRTKWGIVYYHYTLTRTQVHNIVSKREGRILPPLPDKNQKMNINMQKKLQSDFSDAIKDISLKMKNERGARQHGTSNY